MVDWNALLHAVVGSGAGAAIVWLVAQKYAEKRIAYTFDKELKSHESALKITSDQWSRLCEVRMKEYSKLSGLVSSVRRHAIDLCAKSCPTPEEIKTFKTEVDNLQEMVYSLTFILTYDRSFAQVHTYKTTLVNLAKNIENEISLRGMNQTDRADSVREDIKLSLSDLDNGCALITTLLAKLYSDG